MKTLEFLNLYSLLFSDRVIVTKCLYRHTILVGVSMTFYITARVSFIRLSRPIPHQVRRYKLLLQVCIKDTKYFICFDFSYTLCVR